MNKFKNVWLFVIIFFSKHLISNAQTDSVSQMRTQIWNFHSQTTIIDQYHPSFRSAYSGINSLSDESENDESLSTSLFIGCKLWQLGEVYFNPEFIGGSGFSQTRGIAGFTNGEIYRVDDPTPKTTLARLYVKHIFPLSNGGDWQQDMPNQLAMFIPHSYINVSIGKFSVLDFFDCNQYSHDPRSQFYNWALMGNGAWDYPADTRGYTNGVVTEWINPTWSVRLGIVMVPTTRNGPILDTRIDKSHSEALEFEHKYTLGSQSGVVRALFFFTEARMGNYREAIQWGLENGVPPSLDAYPAYGRTKYGAGINVEHTFSPYLGGFFRASWNDGHNESWAFTEIDQAVSGGLSLSGSLWNRKEDRVGIAQIVNGISKDHRGYLAAGGYGFIIGDGHLNYGLECISELYYSFKVPGNPVWFSPDYQFVLNPAYNRDRGPVHVLGLRAHFEI
jgi:high affinity Mn2+ porin